MRHRHDWDERAARRRDLPDTPPEDYGQADYSSDYGYDPVRRAGYRAVDERADVYGRDAYGQADFSEDYGYDPATRTGYRREPAFDARQDSREVPRQDPRQEEARSWRDRGGFFSGLTGGRRRGVSDRVLWVVVTDRLRNAHGLDISDIDVIVESGEVTLNGSVRHRGDKRRAEDLVDVADVTHVQNNLRVRDRRRFGF